MAKKLNCQANFIKHQIMIITTAMTTIKTCATYLVCLIAALSFVSGETYKYIPNVDPHTRYNDLRTECYYYYGYGSCNVTRSECSGVPNGRNRWVNLGDACNRDSPPSIWYSDSMQTSEGQVLTLDVECSDEDPVNLTVTGWLNSKTEFIGYEAEGKHGVHVTCTDSFGKNVSGDMTITILNTNRAPLFKSITSD